MAFLVNTRRSGSGTPRNAAQRSRAEKSRRSAAWARGWVPLPGLAPVSVMKRTMASATPGALGWLVAALSR